VTPDGQPGPSGKGGFAAEAGRYHLYISRACPWAHRTLIFRKLKKLEGVVSLSITHPHMLDNGWEYTGKDGSTADDVNGFSFHYQLYQATDPHYTGHCTVPVLWDKRRRTIVNNESAQIIRMFNRAFNGYTDDRTDYCPAPLLAEIDQINDLIYENINNGVYRCGFATSQPVYEHWFDRLFATLDQLEERLGDQRYLVGDRITEADWRLFTTLLRFDPVYFSHFKCNLRRIADSTCAASPTIATSPIICAISIRCRGWRRRSTWSTSSSTITIATSRSIRLGWCLRARRWICGRATTGIASTDAPYGVSWDESDTSARRARLARICSKGSAGIGRP
jgi:putative glutathione S-transferase